MDGLDLFLSYHRPDADQVAAIRRYLKSHGLRTFFDSEDIPTGQPWPQELERALSAVRAVAVFIGPHGLGKWQKREIWFALDRQANSERTNDPFPVVPILLPGAELVQAFIFMNTWVDLRRDPTDPQELARLLRLVRDRPQEPSATSEMPCPFRGLSAFREEDSGLFFGRQDITEELFQAARDAKTVLLVGPSGSGKSSVIHAGLIPLLRKQRPPQPTWDNLSFTPGDRPFHRFAAGAMPLLRPDLNTVQRMVQTQELGGELARGAVRLEDIIEEILFASGGSERLLVVVDQFEELFTLNMPQERRRFIEAFLSASSRVNACWLISLRADFYGHAIASSRELSDTMNDAVVNLGPLKPDEIRSVIEAPAARTGLEFDAGLVDMILADVQREPGGLPLLEFALTELWSRRDHRTLTHAAYSDVGGVARAIANRAEEEYSRFGEHQFRAVRRIFTRLVRVASPEEGGEDTRRRALMSELIGEAEEETEAIIHRLIDSRLLVASRDQVSGETLVEVAHEALVREWARLRNWLDQDREFHLWRQGLRFRLTEWQQRQEDEVELLRGGALDDALRWSTGRQEDLSELEQRYIAQSITQRRVDLQRQDSEAEIRRVEAELQSARQVQQSLLPIDRPAIPGLELADLCLFAGAVGGDYFDYLPLSDGRLAVIVADVAGHGLGPSLVMVGLRAFLRALARSVVDIVEMTTLLDGFLSEDIGQNRIVTSFLLFMERSSRSFVYCGAGMNSWLIRCSGQIEELESTCVPIGIMSDFEATPAGPYDLCPGDVLLLTTDGVYEAYSPRRELFGIVRLTELVRQSRAESAAEIIQAVKSAIDEWTGAEPFDDDITMVVIKVLPVSNAVS